MTQPRVSAPTRHLALACAVAGAFAASAAAGQTVSTAPRGAGLAAAASITVAPRQPRFVYTATGHASLRLPAGRYRLVPAFGRFDRDPVLLDVPEGGEVALDVLSD